ncbi:MAG: hypothetical protein K6T30_05330 [Alicyclobacillus sp.]|nr:hypothetical protein [Alicyclobacillus sp.]
MVHRFWRGMAALAALGVVFTSLSWFYLQATHWPLMTPGNVGTLLKLPTDFPSLWSFALPAADQTRGAAWFAPVMVLLIQTLLTGGMYGTLIRLNTGQPASVRSFAADGVRSFGRLLLWSLAWTAATSLALGLGRLLGQGTLVPAWLLLAARYLFLFADVALVSEQHTGMANALRIAARSLLTGALPMLPLAVLLTLITGGALYASSLFPPAGVWALAVVYVLVSLWLLHMVTARYLYFSREDMPRVNVRAGT